MNINEMESKLKLQQYEIDFSKLLYLLIQHESLETAVNQAALFLDRSIVITDLSFKVVAHSTSVPVTDSIWISNIKRGHCTRDFISAINELMPSNSLPVDGTPFKVNCDASTENKLASKLICDHQHIGYIVLLDNEKGLLDYHFEYLPRIGDLIVDFLKREPNFNTFFVDIAANILMGMLSGEDSIHTKQRLYAAGIILPKEMQLAIFVPDTSSPHLQAYIKSAILSALPGSHVFIYGNFVVSLFDSTYLFLITQASSECDMMCHVSEVGISLEFEDITEMPKMFQDAARACHLSHSTHKNEKLCLYSDYKTYDLLMSCSDRRLLENSIHPAFEILNEYDIKKESHLLETLKNYILLDFNAKNTAEALYLHRNTLKYRLDKIQELTDLDFENFETKFSLGLSLKINQLLNIF